MGIIYIQYVIVLQWKLENLIICLCFFNVFKINLVNIQWKANLSGVDTERMVAMVIAQLAGCISNQLSVIFVFAYL